MHRVLKSTGSWYLLENEHNDVFSARASGKLRLEGGSLTNPIAVGDYVEITTSGAGDILIERVIPRRNYLLRQSNKLSSKYQILASNIDQVVLMASLVKPFTPPGFIDRLLVSAESFRIPCVLLWNKSDLYGSKELLAYAEIKETYEKIGYPCHLISLEKKQDLDNVKALFKEKTTLITGNSGVGKSTLINVLFPGMERKTSGISSSYNKGTHTTTFAEMLSMGNNTYLIDSPGIKDFGLADLEISHISHYFPEMRALLGSCRFGNCLHLNEPGCAIIESVNNGHIASHRYRIFTEIIDALRH